MQNFWALKGKKFTHCITNQCWQKLYIRDMGDNNVISNFLMGRREFLWFCPVVEKSSNERDEASTVGGLFKPCRVENKTTQRSVDSSKYPKNKLFDGKNSRNWYDFLMQWSTKWILLRTHFVMFFCWVWQWKDVAQRQGMELSRVPLRDEGCSSRDNV